MEVLWRRFNRANKTRKWINPGFMAGPYLPIYGFGLCTLYLLAGMEQMALIENPLISKLVLFAAMAFCMTLIELIAGLIFIRGMHVKLWDYSGEPLNYQGIICLKASVYWSILSALYYFFIHPHILDALSWFASNLTFSFVLGLFGGVMAIDFCYSIQLAAKIRRFAADNRILVRYEELKAHIRKAAEANREKYHFFFAFHSPTPLGEHIRKYAQQRRMQHKDQER